jgi:hypothetical protein
MRKLRWLWTGLGLAAWACSGGYPLEPTPCDELCNTLQGNLYCFDYDPAGCVSQCEREGLSLPICHAALEQTLECYRNAPTELSEVCRQYPGDFPFGCQIPLGWLRSCASDHTGRSYR